MGIPPSIRDFAAQVRAARSLLNWGQKELAKNANLNLSTIADFESERRNPIPNNLAAIRRALEDAGVKFIDAGKSGGIGVRRREALPKLRAAVYLLPR